MRTHGSLTKWNDERGFGFITPAKGTADLFVHISAFPRDGVRPRLNELISFEIEAGPDGKQRAVRVMRPGQGTSRHPAAAHRRERTQGRRFAGSITLMAIVGIGAYAYSEYTKRVAPTDAVASDAPVEMGSPSLRYSCDGRTSCPQMTSCDEAKYFIKNCPNTQMDGDGDGVPCESQWCN
jgi:cold shock CspA family protein